MRVSRAKAAENRARVVETAGRLFREKGFNGIGVADLMKAAGMTHGGFYGHFRSKDDLAAEAVAKALETSQERWRRRIAKNPGNPAGAIIERYLSEKHREDLAQGCPIAALASDTARQVDDVRQAYEDGVKGLLEILADAMPGENARDRRADALAAFSTLVGALLLSRAVLSDDFAREVLEAAHEALSP
ncbi:MAG: TetR/AcrR family transcriptional regulator [Rhizobiaceae bacterium]|nr:TetR/AcrR family transcriptional regulator [Rhizobiaceae bacterium]